MLAVVDLAKCAAPDPPGPIPRSRVREFRSFFPPRAYPAADPVRAGTRKSRFAMSSSRPFLIWLCCALVLWTGVPLPAQTACNSVDRAASVSGDVAEACCVDRCDCCSQVDGLVGKCDCGRQLPEREPATPTRCSPQFAIPAPAWPCPSAVVVPQPSNRGRGMAVAVPIGLLPRISRQKALSVWNC